MSVQFPSKTAGQYECECSGMLEGPNIGVTPPVSPPVAHQRVACPCPLQAGTWQRGCLLAAG